MPTMDEHNIKLRTTRGRPPLSGGQCKRASKRVKAYARKNYLRHIEARRKYMNMYMKQWRKANPGRMKVIEAQSQQRKCAKTKRTRQRTDK